jgi:hypothetical protein
MKGLGKNWWLSNLQRPSTASKELLKKERLAIGVSLAKRSIIISIPMS